MQESNKCPFHKVPLSLRYNRTTGEIAMACFYCDRDDHILGEIERRVLSEPDSKRTNKETGVPTVRNKIPRHIM